MELIIVGVDGSETAARAAERAAHLAVSLDAQLVVLSAFSQTGGAQVEDTGDSINYTANDVARQIAERAIDDLRSRFPDLRAMARAEYGAVADVLVKVAEEDGASLIVVGNKRVQGVKRFLGSIAASVAHHAPCDVYVAHTH